MPMLILLSCAKTMSDVSKTKTPLTTFPGFRKEQNNDKKENGYGNKTTGDFRLLVKADCCNFHAD